MAGEWLYAYESDYGLEPLTWQETNKQRQMAWKCRKNSLHPYYHVRKYSYPWWYRYYKALVSHINT